MMERAFGVRRAVWFSRIERIDDINRNRRFRCLGAVAAAQSR